MKQAKLFRNGQSQAVRLPKEFRFDGEQVYIQRAGNAVILLPIDAPWQTLFESLEQFTDDFATTAVVPHTSTWSTPLDAAPASTPQAHAQTDESGNG